MNEARFWAKVREALNEPPSAMASKLSAEVIAGTPDCLWAIDGKMGLIELKYEPTMPKREKTRVTCAVTAEQRRFLERVAATGGRAQVLLGVAKEWFLLEIHEVPEPSGPGAPKVPRPTLEACRRTGRSGTIKELSKLRAILSTSRDPVDG